MSGALLLTRLAAVGVIVRIPDGEPDELELDAPAGVLTAERLMFLRAHKDDLLRAVQSHAGGDPQSTSTPGPGTYSPKERQLLDGCSAATLSVVDAVKQVFAPLGGVTVEAVTPFKSERRVLAGGLIRQARRDGDHGRAVALRDAWRERVAICMIDGGVPQIDSELIALDELQLLVTLDQPCCGAASVNEGCRE